MTDDKHHFSSARPLTLLPLLLSAAVSLPLVFVLFLVLFHGPGSAARLPLTTTLRDAAAYLPVAYLITLFATAPLHYFTRRRVRQSLPAPSFLSSVGFVAVSGLLVVLAVLIPRVATHTVGEHVLPVATATISWLLASAPLIAAAYRASSSRGNRSPA